MSNYKELIDKRVSEELGTFVDMALDIAGNPELGGTEFRTSAMLVDALRSRGWNVEYPYTGLPTAFNAVKKNGAGPVVSFMAEYDALPEIGHACGHNLNGVMSLLAGVALADAVLDKVPGEIRVVGTPAEETNGAKVEMSEKGVFDGTDFAMMAHASSGMSSPVYRSLALVPVEFNFKGLASHAASSPWDGLNALNAIQLLFHALDMLRQHVRPETRIHGVITKGGNAPNIVPDSTQAQFYFRSPSRSYLETVLEKAYDCARGAALCTGTEVSWRHHETSFHEILPNPEVEKQMASVLDEVGIHYSNNAYAGGSTDVGNVSWRCPTMHLHLSFTEKRIAMHTKEYAELAGDRNQIESGIKNGARAIARMGLIVLTNPEARGRMKDDLEQARKSTLL
ncbi:MAG: M20 family metallopeptidase [Synergistaceae bacterium]|nr:M20 family metallopeptidase [Synergistaceae bacterium]